MEKEGSQNNGDIVVYESDDSQLSFSVNVFEETV